MWKYKLGLNICDFPGLTTEDQITLFRQVGFDAFFTGWWQGAPIARWKAHAEEVGMEYQSIHSPFRHAANLWRSSEIAKDGIDELIACLRDCAENEIPIMIAHVFIGFTEHTPTPEGIENYGKVATEAKKLGVKLAFENTEGEEYLASLMEAFADNDYVGFCWDTGHEMCYNRSKDMLSLYGDRLIATHLNDNLGVWNYNGEILSSRDDLHLLPFDGIGDWQGIADRLDHHHFDGVMTFELKQTSHEGRHENDVYREMTPVRYVTEAYKRACRVAALRGKNQ
ncbi:MAG: sugar phosphate isomerase/epimerase [Clostridia bacterium]|nr:sugar phosphate isomerase/epimerase [Clostridia bacterium]MBQ4574488.1 sugar phosphate isomerase/epimerase [Clostridia bacterium]